MGAVAGGGGGGIGVPERVLWSYVVQIGSAIKVIHGSGLAVRNLEASRVIVTGKNRVRIGGCGVLDVLGWDGSPPGGYQVRSPPFGWQGSLADIRLVHVQPGFGLNSRTTFSRSASSSFPSLAAPSRLCTTSRNPSTTSRVSTLPTSRTSSFTSSPSPARGRPSTKSSHSWVGGSSAN